MDTITILNRTIKLNKDTFAPILNVTLNLNLDVELYQDCQSPDKLMDLKYKLGEALLESINMKGDTKWI